MKAPQFHRRTRVRSLLGVLAACAFSGVAVNAASYTWVPTAALTTYDWPTTSQDNWGTGIGGAFPNAAGDVANINNNIVGNQTIRLQQGITIGQLNLGDSDGTHIFTISSGTGTQTLTFEGATAGAATAVNLGSTASVTISNVISTNVTLGGTSPLTINALGAQRLTTQTGTFSTNGNSITLTGGVTQTPIWSLNGDLFGNGTITVNSLGGVTVSGAKSFTVTFVLNRGLSGASNAGSLSVTSGSIANAAEVVVNGYFTASGTTTTQQGGVLQAGNNSAALNNPGQRFTQNTITLNGGSLSDNGQTATMGVANPWQQGLETVNETVATLRFNSGYSQVFVGVGGNTAGTRLNVTNLVRSPGATGWGRSATWGGTAQMTFGNIATGNNGGSFLIGGGGVDGSTTMSIIPWMGASLTNGSAGNPDGFVTHTATGIRALNTNAAGEYATTIAAGATNNVSTATITLASDTTVNSLRYTTASTGNFGVGRTLTVTSGGIFFTTTGSIGTPGSATAGTLNFGGAEGVVWANGVNTNGIGAAISGSMGLTKAGAGKLVLTGNNTYTGLTSVSGGVLQVGDGSNPSRLGLSGNVIVGNGATLALFNADAIADTAILSLQNFGASAVGLNGRASINNGLNESIGGLYLGDTFYNGASGPTTFGALGSGAAFESDLWFVAGTTGILTVVPEPGSAALLLAGFGLALGRRRRG